MISNISRGRLSRYTHESKFTTSINTRLLAKQAIIEGNELRKTLSGRRVLVLRNHDEWELKNAFRL